MPWICLILLVLFSLVLTPPVLAADAPSPISPPIRPLEQGLDPQRQLAQKLALASSELRAKVRDKKSGGVLRSEVFGVYPLRPSDITEGTKACRDGECYSVEVYNYALNTTHTVVVDLEARKLVHLADHYGAQPELPPRLTELAIRIATTAPEVIEALGFEPTQDDPTMPNVKTSLNGTECERSRHLCVAPTFVLEQKALWAIVDLTDERLVGVRWTDVGSSRRGIQITEESVKLEDVFENYCKKSNRLERDGWVLDYILTSSDGMRVSDVSFLGRPILKSAKLLDWHVSYSSRDGFGYSDAAGCPMFSSATVLAFGGPVVEAIEEDGKVAGFALVQDFRQPHWPLPCNYRYMQRYEFYRDGRFRVAGTNIGRGCGKDGTYRPVLRIHLDPAAAQRLAAWDASQWKPWEFEQWTLLGDKDDAYDPQGRSFRFDGTAGGYFVTANRGQFPDGAPGDRAYVYLTRYKPDEGDADMVTIGPCCNEDHHQGPEKFIDAPPESLEDGELVLWYVAQLKNDAEPGREHCWAEMRLEGGVYRPQEWPCTMGPLFTPVSESEQKSEKQ